MTFAANVASISLFLWPPYGVGQAIIFLFCGFFCLSDALYKSTFYFYGHSEKNLLNSNISSACLHDIVNFGPLATEISVYHFGAPQQTSTGFACWPRYCTDVALAPRGIFQVQNSLFVQVLRSPVLAALLYGTQAVGVSQTAASYKEWN